MIVDGEECFAAEGRARKVNKPRGRGLAHEPTLGGASQLLIGCHQQRAKTMEAGPTWPDSTMHQVVFYILAGALSFAL